MIDLELAKQARLIQIRKRLIQIVQELEPESLTRSQLIEEGRKLQADHLVLCGQKFDFENDVAWDAANSES